MSSASTKSKENRARGERSLQVGKWVQKEVGLFLQKAGLTVNGSEEDEHGWDLLVEFPSALDVVPFLDRIPPAASCFVQVKSIEKPGARVRMTLSNALKRAKSPIPNFIAIARILESNIAELWIIHCDESFVERVLSRAATAANQKDGTGKSLNEIDIEIPVPKQPGTPFDPVTLRHCLTTHMGPSPEKYFEQKQRWLANVGYKGPRKQITVSFSNMAPDEYYSSIAEFAVGLRKSLPMKRVDVKDIRFGLTRHEERFEQGELSIPSVPNLGRVSLVVECAGEHECRLSCTSHLARAMFPFIPENFDLAVLRAPFFQFVMRFADAEPEATWSVSGLAAGLSMGTLADAARAAAFMRIMSMPGSTLSFVSNGTSKIPLAFHQASQKSGTGYLQAVEDLHVVTRLMNLAADYQFSFEAVQEHAEDLRYLALGSSIVHVDIVVQLGPDSLSDSPALGEICAILSARRVRFGDETLVGITGIIGSLSSSADASIRKISSKSVRLLAKHVFTSLDETSPEVYKEAELKLYKEAEGKLEAEGISRIYRPGEADELKPTKMTSNGKLLESAKNQ